MKEAPQALSPKKAWEEAYDVIQNQILSMHIKPGEAVTEIVLSDRLGIGRTPVREALKRLEQEGLIITHNQRKRVYILSIREIGEIFDLKTAIEGNVAKWASRRGSEEDFTNLYLIQQEMEAFLTERATTQKEEEDWLQAWLNIDRRLHAQLFKMAGSPRSEVIIQNLNRQWHRLKVGILAMEGRIDKTVFEHQKFVAAILQKDPVAARNLMEEHLENLKRELVKLLNVYHYPTA